MEAGNKKKKAILTNSLLLIKFNELVDTRSEGHIDVGIISAAIRCFICR
jgi:hypothetical protein